MSATIAPPASRSPSQLWLRFAVRALVLLWGACLLYFVTASSLGGLTTPREVLTRLLVVGGIATLPLLGLLLVVWRSEGIAAWLVFALAALLALVMIVPSFMPAVAMMRSSQPILDPWALLGVDLVNVVVMVGPLVVTGWLLLTSARIATAQEHGALPARLQALALRVGSFC